jgi:hypothetical protein
MPLVALLAVLFAFPFVLFNAGGAVPNSGVGTPKGAVLGSKATLTLKSLEPLIVSGRGFKAQESVRITGAGAKTARASARGTFTVRMVGAGPCASLTIQAIGSKGSRASLNFSQLLCREQ